MCNSTGMMYGYRPVITPSLCNFTYSTPVACGSRERDSQASCYSCMYLYPLESLLEFRSLYFNQCSCQSLMFPIQCILILFYAKRESVWTFQHIHLIKFQRHHPKVVSVTIVHNYNSICFLLGEKETFILFLNLLDEQISSWRTVLELFFYGVSLFLRWIFSCLSSIMLHEMVYVALGYFLVLFVCLFSGKE